VLNGSPDDSERSSSRSWCPDFLLGSDGTHRPEIADAFERTKMRVVPGCVDTCRVAHRVFPRAIVAPIVGAFYKKLGGE